LPLAVIDELLSACMLAPLYYCDMRMRIDETIACSDASESAGAVCRSTSLTQYDEAQAASACVEHVGQCEEDLIVVEAFAGIGGARRAIDV
jgi:hypothetical protein